MQVHSETCLLCIYVWIFINSQSNKASVNAARSESTRLHSVHRLRLAFSRRPLLPLLAGRSVCECVCVCVCGAECVQCASGAAEQRRGNGTAAVRELRAVEAGSRGGRQARSSPLHPPTVNHNGRRCAVKEARLPALRCGGCAHTMGDDALARSGTRR